MVYTIHYAAEVANLWPAGQMWPFSNSKEQKKYGKIGKKARVDGPQQEKVPNFPIFWPTYLKRLATPAIQYTPYNIHLSDMSECFTK